MEPQDYQTSELTNEEMAEVTKELQDVLEKYDCEMQVLSNIHILKRQNVETPEKVDVISSPYDGTDKTADSTTEESGKSTD